MRLKWEAKCPACGNIEDVEDNGENGEVGCEDCGSHPAFYCDQCDTEPLDLIFNSVEISIKVE